MPTIDLSYINTTPGADDPFAPPADFEGDAEAYARWLTRRYSSDPGFRQYMVLVTRAVCRRSQFMTPPRVEGPFQARLETACMRLDAMLHATQLDGPPLAV